MTGCQLSMIKRSAQDNGRLYAQSRQLKKQEPCFEATVKVKSTHQKQKRRLHGYQESPHLNLAGLTGLEPATSGVTGRRCNRLYYSPLIKL